MDSESLAMHRHHAALIKMQMDEFIVYMTYPPAGPRKDGGQKGRQDNEAEIMIITIVERRLVAMK